MQKPNEKLKTRRPRLSKHLLFWPIVCAGVLADLWSKAAVFEWLSKKPFAQFSVIDGFLQLVIRENAGAAFSIAAGQRWLLAIVSIIALIAVVCFFLFVRLRQKLVQIALALFTAGIIGNLYDRLFNDGMVRDFIDVYYGRYHWPAFNVADSMLCVGVGLFIIANITAASSRKPAHPQK